MFIPILYGLLASLFFSFTFILNRRMDLGGGSYLWSASLRYLIMLPILYIILKIKKRDRITHIIIKKKWKKWILWSTIGFGIFYLPLCMGSAFGQSWLIVGFWQTTIVAGILLTPLFDKPIPKRNLLFAFIILFGVFLLQVENIKSLSFKGSLLSIIPVIIAAIAYPLGNRKMMEMVSDDMSTLQRVYGMTLCSMPFWIIVMIVALVKVGLPSTNQLFQSSLVAIFSGVIATLLFFRGTDLTRNDPKKLAIVESTIAGEIIFTVLGSIFILKDRLPTEIGWTGLGIIVCGLLLNNFSANIE